MRRFWIVCGVIFIAFSCPIKAQDIHFTQFESSPMTLNPALTGLFEGSHRFAVNNRMQWRSVTVPYLTVAASLDMPIVIREYKRDIIGLGFNIFRDVAGDSHFGTTQLNYSLSYIKAIDHKNVNFLSVGFINGIAQRTISYTDLTFDSQFDGYQYDANLNNKETFERDNFMYMDLGIGANWRYQPKAHKIVNTGISYSHINKPGQSFIDDSKIRLDPKFTFYSYGIIEAIYGIDLLPKIIFQKQGAYRELILGFATKFIRRPKPADYLAVHTGFYFRSSDALVLQGGLDMKSTYVSLSYDFNISGLVPASTSRGGFELAIVYKISKLKKVRVKTLTCPIF
ncbi:MAG: PorP/SprF family type IX secretion system membrane protein [Bacteroidota bacterium]